MYLENQRLQGQAESMQQAHILITDDDKQVRYILAKFIQRLGYQVLEAGSGEEALRILNDPASPPIDLMLTGIWMPNMSGVELLQATRRIRPDLPVAIITGAATLDTSIAALNAGAYAYLTKPIQNDQVRDILSRGLTKQKEIQEQRAAQRDLLERYQELEQHLAALQERPPAMSQAAPGDFLVELIRGLRHELGNATTAIKLNLSVLEEQGTNPAYLHEHLQDLQISTDHLIFLLGKLKEYPRNRLATELADLRQILLSTESLTSAYPTARLDFSLPEDEIVIQAAPMELSRAFQRIVENAIEANQQMGHTCVKITVEMGQEAIIVTISDEGPGFPNAMLDKLFSPGYTTKTNEGAIRGLGFGLFTAQAVVNLHGGHIWLENRAEGGASVHVQLPLARSIATA